MKNTHDTNDTNDTYAVNTINDSSFGIGVGALMGSLGRLLRHFLFAPPLARTAPQVSQTARRPVTPLRRAVQPTRRAITPFHGAAQAHDHANCSSIASRSPLRIIRVVESGQAPTLTGRMIMSGRMADVCAELDRMVEREAAMQAGV